MDNRTLNELISKIQDNKPDDPKAVDDFINRNLTPSQAQTVNKVLSDPELIEKLLSSQQARNLLNKLTGGEG